jgi:hypothetical protein
MISWHHHHKQRDIIARHVWSSRVFFTPFSTEFFAPFLRREFDQNFIDLLAE